MSKALGVLTVEVLGARNLVKKDFLGKNDPYAIVHFGRQSQTTHTVKNAGSNCAWNQTFYFDVTPEIRDITVQVFDKDTFTKDDFIGTSVLPLDPILRQKGSPPQWYPLRAATSKISGEIHLAFNYRSLDQSQGSYPISSGPHTYDSLYPIREEMKRTNIPPSYPSSSSSSYPSSFSYPSSSPSSVPPAIPSSIPLSAFPSSSPTPPSVPARQEVRHGNEPNPFANSTQISPYYPHPSASMPTPPPSSYPSPYPPTPYPSPASPYPSSSHPSSPYPPSYPPHSSSSPFSSTPYPPSFSPYPPSSSSYPPAPTPYPPAPFLPDELGPPMPVAPPALPGWDFSGARQRH